MLTDDGDERARPDPRARGRRGIEIVDRTAGRVNPVERVACSAIGALRDRLIELPVRDAGKRPALIDHARERIRKRWMPDAVEHDRTDGHLSGIRLTARLGRDEARKQIDLRAGHAAGAARISAAVRRQSQRLKCLRTGFPVGCEAVFALKGAHGAFGRAAVDPVYVSVVVAPIFELGLDLRYDGAA